MKHLGYIQPIPATAELWHQLQAAKSQRNFVEVGRLSAEIRTMTQRHGHNDDGIGDSGVGTDSTSGVDG